MSTPRNKEQKAGSETLKTSTSTEAVNASTAVTELLIAVRDAKGNPFDTLAPTVSADVDTKLGREKAFQKTLQSRADSKKSHTEKLKARVDDAKIAFAEKLARRKHNEEQLKDESALLLVQLLHDVFWVSVTEKIEELMYRGGQVDLLGDLLDMAKPKNAYRLLTLFEDYSKDMFGKAEILAMNAEERNMLRECIKCFDESGGMDFNTAKTLVKGSRKIIVDILNKNAADTLSVYPVDAQVIPELREVIEAGKKALALPKKDELSGKDGLGEKKHSFSSAIKDTIPEPPKGVESTDIAARLAKSSGLGLVADTESLAFAISRHTPGKKVWDQQVIDNYAGRWGKAMMTLKTGDAKKVKLANRSSSAEGVPPGYRPLHGYPNIWAKPDTLLPDPDRECTIWYDMVVSSEEKKGKGRKTFVKTKTESKFVTSSLKILSEHLAKVGQIICLRRVNVQKLKKTMHEDVSAIRLPKKIARSDAWDEGVDEESGLGGDAT